MAEQFCVVIYKQHIILGCVKRNMICKHEESRVIIVSFNHNSQTILILHCREARGSREKHFKCVRWWIDVFFKVQTREERPLFKLYRGIISFHSHLLSYSCVSDYQEKFMEQLFYFNFHRGACKTDELKCSESLVRWRKNSFTIEVIKH